MCWQSNHQKLFYIFNMQFHLHVLIFFKMGLTTSESSSSSSQCLSAARGSPTTLSSPITPCCKQRQGVLMFNDIYVRGGSHTYTHTMSYFHHTNMDAYLWTYCLVILFREFPLSTKSEGSLKSPVLACEVPLSLPRTQDLIHVPTQDTRTDTMNAI